MTSADIIKILQETSELKRVKIGALNHLAGNGFTDVAHVIYIVNLRTDSEFVPRGDCACLIVTTSGAIGLELSTSLNEFWNYWELQRSWTLSELPNVAMEVAYFFRHQKPSDVRQYCYRDGKPNARLHRAMRSMQKCEQLRQVFGLELVASEF